MNTPCKHLLIALLGAAGFIASTFASAADETRLSAHVTSNIYLQRTQHVQTQTYFYYLIPAPPADVRDALKQRLEASRQRGYEWKDDSAALWTMDSSWVSTSMRHSDTAKRQIQALLTGAAHPVFDNALNAGVLTLKESELFRQAVSGQTDIDEDIAKQAPFFTQIIDRWAFLRSRGKRVEFTDSGGVMDVSPMFQRTPMTLLWFTGSRVQTRHELRMGVTTVGGPGFFGPHLEESTDTSVYVDPALDEASYQVAQALKALPNAEADANMQDFFRPWPKENRIQADKLPTAADIALDALPLPSDEARLRNNKRWSLLALPDGSVVAAGEQTRRYRLDGKGQVAYVDTPASFSGEGGIKSNKNGVIAGFNRENARLHLVAWNATNQAVMSVPLPMFDKWRPDDWVMTANGRVGLRADSNTYDIDPVSGKIAQHTWDSRLRHDTQELLDQVMPFVKNSGIRFNDGLLWNSDRDLYGISSETGKVAASIQTSTSDIFFGYRHAAATADTGWALTRPGSPDEGVYTAIDITTGQPYAYLKGPSYLSSFARSAHGRLLVLTGDLQRMADDVDTNSVITVFDMTNGKPVANLIPPKGFAASAVAFNWKGNQLWLYLRGTQDASQRRMAIWSVPKPFVDAAKEAEFPDQFRCAYLDKCSF